MKSKTLIPKCILDASISFYYQRLFSLDYLNASFLMVFLFLLSFLSSFPSKSRVIQTNHVNTKPKSHLYLTHSTSPQPRWQASRLFTLPSSFQSQGLHILSLLCLGLSFYPLCMAGSLQILV